MDKPCVYEIRVEGQLTDRWSDWLGGLALQPEANGETTLRGPLPDQAALLGILAQLHALNLTLVSVLRTRPSARTETESGVTRQPIPQ